MLYRARTCFYSTWQSVGYLGGGTGITVLYLVLQWLIQLMPVNGSQCWDFCKVTVKMVTWGYAVLYHFYTNTRFKISVWQNSTNLRNPRSHAFFHPFSAGTLQQTVSISQCKECQGDLLFVLPFIFCSAQRRLGIMLNCTYLYLN